MKLHVISFQVPYPADYGGAIDVFYKLKALKEQGFDVTLHTFYYGERGRQPILDELCEKVYYYSRHTGWLKQISTLPYIVVTRNNKELLENLCADDAPILFEGIHTCYFLTHPRLRYRKKIVRMHNIEYEYYRRLAQQSGWSWKTLYYWIESIRLHTFEDKLKYADLVCAISKADAQKIKARHKDSDVILLPCFFDASIPTERCTTEAFVLYHGNLAVEENHRAAEFIIRHIAPQCPDIPFVIMGRSPKLNDLPQNVTVMPDPKDDELKQTLRKARIHLMLTFQPTGIKLKLLNTLIHGQGHVIANHDMLYGHSLGKLCVRANTPEEIAANIRDLINKPLDEEELEKRKATLLKMEKAGISRLSLFK